MSMTNPPKDELSEFLMWISAEGFSGSVPEAHAAISALMEKRVLNARLDELSGLANAKQVKIVSASEIKDRIEYLEAELNNPQKGE